MAYPEKKSRNKKIAQLREVNKLTFQEIANRMKITKRTTAKIYYRELARAAAK